MPSAPRLEASLRIAGFALAAPFLAGALILAPGCDSEALWGDGPGATASVTTPSGVQTGDVTITYTLAGEMDTADIKVDYTTDGSIYRAATEGPGSDGTENLSVSAVGEFHTFVWSSASDLSERRESGVKLRIFPKGGQSDTTSSMPVHNVRFLVVAEKPPAAGSAGKARLYSVDVLGGAVTFAQTVNTGGTDPFDVLHDSDVFFVSNETSGSISVFRLDGVNRILIPVAGSPFPGGIAQPRYLATDGHYLFVSGGGNSVGVLERDDSTDALSFKSSVAVDGCRSLVVRSGYLYIAREAAGEIVLYNIEADGELLLNGYSPITTGGLVSPRAMVLSGTRIYAANASTATICGFNVLGGGSLSALTGSPFAMSVTGSDGLARGGDKLLAVEGSSLVSFAVDAFGGLAEDAASPLALSGPSVCVISAGSVVLAATTTSQELQIWTVDDLGVLVSAASSPFDTGVENSRMAISD